ncbi:growth-regulating factor 7-like isoform X2 [Musa acuminata AAA Group]|uniref:growth-regulating factor 7-like isoform X2 n=1 Tax=Musa acuminata AAA Group TaxID=214697 RepID=UPI0031E2DD27
MHRTKPCSRSRTRRLEVEGGEMDLGGLIGVDDGLVTSASSFHGGDVLSSFHGRHDWSCLKMAKTEASSLLPDGEQPLDFSASKPESLLLTSDGRVPTSSYTGHAGLHFGRLGVNSQGSFTPSQLMELENQTLIYNYIDANARIPSNPFSPIGFSAFSTGSLRASACTELMGSFHGGTCGNADSEPGRCRRTDGKKWRCTRNAVGDQKYCERHLNRGRHRSRKPVEGPCGRATRPTPFISSSQAGLGSRSCDGLAMARQQMSNLQPQLNRIKLSEEKASTRSKVSEELCKLTLLSSFPCPKLSFHEDFGFVSTCSSSLPPSSSRIDNKRNVLPPFELDEQQLQPRQFTWYGRGDMQFDSDELSAPMPMISDFLSCSSSPHESSVIWEGSAGGPLAEALKNTGKAPDHAKQSSLDLSVWPHYK